MNTILRVDGGELWQLAGWTMLHFLWVGTLIGLAAAIGRVIVRRAAPSVRYAVALGCLCMLGGSPGGIAAWLVVHGFASSVRPDAPISIGADFDSNVDATIAAAGSGEALHEPVPQAQVPTQPHPRPSRGLPGIVGGSAIEGATLALESCAQYLPWLWLIGTPLTFIVLTTGLVGAERLRRASRVLAEGPIVEACERLQHAMQISRGVAVAICERVATPVLVGIVRPMILLPPSALTGWSIDDIEMVLLHELAHVRRWDNLVNLLQRMVESLLFFHPAVWLLSSWVRQEREACCDAVVVGRTERPHAYAELLVALAAQMPRSVLFYPAATSAMAAGPLRGRIRRILQLEDDPMLVSGKSFVLLVGSVVVAATLTVLYLPARGQAKESAPQGKQELTADYTEKKSISEQDNVAKGAATLTADEPTFLNVPFVDGTRRFSDGDSITIREVRGTAATFEPGNVYWIKGTYTLNSHDRATLLADYTTENDSANGTRPTWKVQTAVVNRGSGSFVLCLPMSNRGWPHVSFYPAGGGECLGGIYFGTGEWVLKQWWGSKEAVDATDISRAVSTETQQSDEDTRKVSINIDDKQTSTAEAQPGRLRLQIRRTEGASGRFPSLEEQKLADLAYLRTGLELEPIGNDDLNRVKALGYDGGVKIIGWAPASAHRGGDGIQTDDILVGLHVWPTTSLKEVAELLNRDDLAELSPLKYYVIRNQAGGQDAAGEPVINDTVVKGRILVDFDRDSRSTSRGSLAPSQGTDSRPVPAPYHVMVSRVDDVPPTPADTTRYSAPAAPIPTAQAPESPLAPPAPIKVAAPPAPAAPTAPDAPIAIAVHPAVGMPQASTPTQVMPAAGAVRVGGKWLGEEIAADPKIAELRQQLIAAETELQITSSGRGRVDSESVEKLQKQVAELEQSIAEQAQKKKSEFLAGQEAALNNAARQAAAAMAAAQIALERAAKEHDELTSVEARGGGRGSEVDARQALESAKRLDEAKRQFEQQKRAVEDVKRQFEELRRQGKVEAGDVATEAKQAAEEAAPRNGGRKTRSGG